MASYSHRIHLLKKQFVVLPELLTPVKNKSYFLISEQINLVISC